MKESKKPKT